MDSVCSSASTSSAPIQIPQNKKTKEISEQKPSFKRQHKVIEKSTTKTPQSKKDETLSTPGKTISNDLPKPGECFKCRNLGHNWKDCTNTGHKYFCYKCGKPRVIKTNCPNCSTDQEENSKRDQSEG